MLPRVEECGSTPAQQDSGECCQGTPWRRNPRGTCDQYQREHDRQNEANQVGGGRPASFPVRDTEGRQDTIDVLGGQTTVSESSQWHRGERSQ